MDPVPVDCCHMLVKHQYWDIVNTCALSAAESQIEARQCVSTPGLHPDQACIPVCDLTWMAR